MHAEIAGTVKNAPTVMIAIPKYLVRVAEKEKLIILEYKKPMSVILVLRKTAQLTTQFTWRQTTPVRPEWPPGVNQDPDPSQPEAE